MHKVEIHKEIKKMTKFYIQDREAGNVIVWFDTKEEAEKNLLNMNNQTLKKESTKRIFTK